MENEEVYKQLDVFAKDIIRQSRANMTRRKLGSGGALYDSISSNVEVFKNSIAVEILMEHYGKFVDQGVSGNERKFNTPFSFRDKMPPPSVFNKWILQKKIAPRDEKGKFVKRRSMQFAIAKSIQKRGIKPTKFFSDAVESALSRLPDTIAEAYALDLEFFVKQNLGN